ncbi:MAG: M1 family metallopeptidase, partial [Ferruginibacter sp.]|nr:M1 family metallopeptidase [Ferruginibacter sp.]
PHFYPTDSLMLDAKGMDIQEISITKGSLKSKLKYDYDGLQLSITLDKTYKAGEKYTLYIAYTAKPDELKTKGSAAITNAKGLYFINPTGTEKDKPTQIWTQGETEANSVWMPTIDKPNQKSTEEILMIVPSKYVTLSNGLLINKKVNPDGTRTDHWKMDLPHAPYLFFMGVGDFSVIKDSYKGKEVSYYVEKEQAPYAKGVFGKTPEMMQFFSDKLKLEFPWAKYAQMVARDYVSGAMENTTATLHQASAYQNFRQLTEGNKWEETIAHELFHQWFGDLVTAESWSHLTVNESFANYSEYLWDEYKHGKDFADDHNLDDMQGYIQSGSGAKNLVRYHYADKEDMFDAVSYNKGGRILHMLRNYVGDEAFFKSLNTYLTTNKFKTGEAGQLRLAFEEVTGQDLNWFWNQWYYGSGHPKVDISYINAPTTQMVIVKQTQTGDKVFKLPLTIDVYEGKSAKRYKVWTENRTDTFSFATSTPTSLINVDADKILLWEKTDNKTTDQYIFQYENAKNFMDRREALRYFSQKALPELAMGLTDKFAGLRTYTLNAFASAKTAPDAAVVKKIALLADTEKDKLAKAAAISLLVATKDAQYESLYKKFVDDSSYSVSAAALEGLSALSPEASYGLAKKYSADAKGALGTAVFYALLANGTDADFEFVSKQFAAASPNQEKLEMTAAYADYLTKVNDVSKIKKAIDDIIIFRGFIPKQFRNVTDPVFKQSLDQVGKAKGADIQQYITEVFK